MYVQVARYLGYACIQQKYLKKIYTCLGSKIPHEKKGKKKQNKNKQEKEINNEKKRKKREEKRKISCLAEKPTCF